MSFKSNHRAAAEQHLAAASEYYAQAADAETPNYRAAALNHASRGVALSKARSTLAMAVAMESIAAVLAEVLVPSAEPVGEMIHGRNHHTSLPLFDDKADATDHAGPGNTDDVLCVRCVCGCGDIAWTVIK